MLNHETNETPQSHPSIGDVGNSRLDGGHESLKRSERSTGDGGEHRAQKKKVKDKDGKRKKRKGPSQDLSEAGTGKISRSRNNPSYRGYDEDVGTSSRKTTKKGKKKKVRFSFFNNIHSTILHIYWEKIFVELCMFEKYVFELFPSKIYSCIDRNPCSV